MPCRSLLVVTTLVLVPAHEQHSSDTTAWHTDIPEEELDLGHHSSEEPLFFFVGYGTFDQAISLCADHNAELPMMENKLEEDMFQAVIHAELEEGRLTHVWPKNTVWLGGVWNSVTKRWMWDDGREVTEIKRSIGESSPADHSSEAKLCQLVTGQWEDSMPHHTFGVICENPNYMWPTTTTTSTTPPITTTVPEVEIAAAVGGAVGAAGLIAGGLLAGLLHPTTTSTQGPMKSAKAMESTEIFADPPIQIDARHEEADAVEEEVEEERTWLVGGVVFMAVLALIAVGVAFTVGTRPSSRQARGWKECRQFEGVASDSEQEPMVSDKAARVEKVQTSSVGLAPTPTPPVVTPPAFQHQPVVTALYSRPTFWNAARAVPLIQRFVPVSPLGSSQSYSIVQQNDVSVA